MTKEIYITKATGEVEPWKPEKLVNSLMKSGAPDDVAEKVVEEVEKELKDGDSTEDIYKKAFDLLRKEAKPAAARYSLRKAIMELGPTGFPFEQFVAEIFRSQGFETKNDCMVKGKCTDHEIDIVAWKPDKLIMSEAKFHNQLGIKSDLKVVLYINSRWEDLSGVEFEKLQSVSQTAESGGNSEVDLGGKRKLDEGWLITNTKFSEKAIEYARCKGMKLVGWNYPEVGNLQDLIEEAHLHPITCLTSITPADEKVLLSAGVILCKQAAENLDILKQSGLSDQKIAKMLEEIKLIQK